MISVRHLVERDHWSHSSPGLRNIIPRAENYTWTMDDGYISCKKGKTNRISKHQEVQARNTCDSYSVRKLQ